MNTRSLLRIGCLALGAFLLMGAGKAKKAPNDKPQPEPQEAVKPELVVSTQGVGPLSAGTPFDAEAVREALPGYVVMTDSGSTEGLEFPVIKVLDKQKELLVITPADKTSIFSIRVKSGQVDNTLGAELGASYAEVYKRGAAPDCTAGLEEESGLVICPAPSAPNVLYVFESTEPTDTPDGTVPPQKVLRKYSLIEIVWKPAPGAKKPAEKEPAEDAADEPSEEP